jgi:hypothetical protein
LSFEKDNKKKNSYAASFGISKIPEDKRDFYKKALKGFNHITVREKQGAKIIKNLTGRDVEVALDPTLLLRREEWDRVAAENDASDYLLIYSFGLTSTMKLFAEKLSKRTSCRIVCLPASYSIFNLVKGKYIKKAGPEEYLGYFRNARCVVTNSFHGALFSINYNKAFYFERNTNNSRFDNLVDLFDLHDREIINGENCNIENPIDYTHVNVILEQ